MAGSADSDSDSDHENLNLATTMLVHTVCSLLSMLLPKISMISMMYVARERSGADGVSE